MTVYNVSVLERWLRHGIVEASSPEEALILAQDDAPCVAWEEAEYLSDIEESAEAYDVDGTVYGF